MPKRDKVKGEWRKLHIEDAVLHRLNSFLLSAMKERFILKADGREGGWGLPKISLNLGHS
jgi:hypothetical protein